MSSIRENEGVKSRIGWRSSRGRLLLILALALVVRVAAVSWVGWNTLAFGDARDYLATAGQLCESGEYPAQGDLPFFRAPGLPLAIVAGTLCHPGQIWLVKLLNVVFDTLTVLVVFALGRVLLSSEPLALLAALAAAINPVFVAQVTDVRSEPLFMLLLTTALLCFFTARANQRQRPIPALLLAGGFLGLAALTRPSALIGIPFFAVAWLAAERPSRRRASGALALVAAAATVLAPWVIRNALATGELILVNDAGGYNVWRGTHPEMRAVLASANREEYRERIQHFHDKTQARAAAEVAARAVTPGARSRQWLELAIERVREHPAMTARILAANLGRYWRPWLSPLEHSPNAVVLSGIILIPFLGFGFAGLLLFAHRDRTAAAIVVAWLAVTWLAHAPFQVVMRFRIPYTDPLLLILAALAFTSFCTTLARSIHETS